ncbi:hypothetical protein CEP52_000954 [Fusarium oligoseptatum]|uniref:FAD-binding oxidoreductase/transferase type 4 C-terminal domain-containing protein n=1 Tax=Fusarium oligoseptatum TaxID=2604345 RepID=A0A428UL87_9HYPO|nr:hypothetical protein CEP52_000954 [Fusarium oligoseptatum]
MHPTQYAMKKATDTTLFFVALIQTVAVLQAPGAVFPFEDLRGAVSAAADIIRRGVQVAAVELMDETQMRIVNEGGATRPRVWKETLTLFLKFSGTKGTVDDNIKTVREIMKPYSPLTFESARDEHEQKILWSARKEPLYPLGDERGW